MSVASVSNVVRRFFRSEEEKNRLCSECSPLKTYDEVMNWECDDVSWAKKVKKMNGRTNFCLDNEDPFLDSHPLPSLQLSPDKAPKTLVCHDMMGGYREDRFVEDTEVTEEPYRFFHWSSIDVFVYFSHYFVTIPPVGWINAGHLHGVPVLGTVITENEAGEFLCRHIFTSKEMVEGFSMKLAEICQHYGFDGYLLNIENKIDPLLMENLKIFLVILKMALKEACSGRDIQVIWYDSVIEPSGELKWQNKLNDCNQSFFDLSDGIFLNYCWTLDDLRDSYETAKNSVYMEELLHGKCLPAEKDAYVKGRQRDVYVGIDVFGRNCHGGGGFNTVEALQVIRKSGLSAAIFAPGWTYELDREDFLSREYNFWKKLQPQLATYGPTTLPFRTTFCQGFGQKIYKEGDVCSDNPWFNLSKQNYQPAFCTCPASEITSTVLPSCMKVCTDKAFEGGSCLQWSSCIQKVPIQSCRLFACDFIGSGKDKMFHITFAYYFTEEPDDDSNIQFTILAVEKCIKVGGKKLYSGNLRVLMNDGVVMVVKVSKQFNDCNVDCVELPDRSVHYPNGWHKRTYQLAYNGEMSLREIRFKTTCKFPVLLGLLEITSS